MWATSSAKNIKFIPEILLHWMPPLCEPVEERTTKSMAAATSGGTSRVIRVSSDATTPTERRFQ
jgi:hypothetical protein